MQFAWFKKVLISIFVVLNTAVYSIFKSIIPRLRVMKILLYVLFVNSCTQSFQILLAIDSLDKLNLRVSSWMNNRVLGVYLNDEMLRYSIEGSVISIEKNY